VTAADLGSAIRALAIADIIQAKGQMASAPPIESIGSRRIYYHSGLDIGGAEGMVDVLAATSGLVVGVGKAVLDSEKDNASLDRQYNDTIGYWMSAAGTISLLLRLSTPVRLWGSSGGAIDLLGVSE